MRDRYIIGGDNDSSVIDGLDSIEDMLVNGRWVNFRVFLFWTDIERTLTVAMVVLAMRRLQILVLVVLLPAPSWSIGKSGELGVRSSTILLGSTCTQIVF